MLSRSDLGGMVLLICCNVYRKRSDSYAASLSPDRIEIQRLKLALETSQRDLRQARKDCSLSLQANQKERETYKSALEATTNALDVKKKTHSITLSFADVLEVRKLKSALETRDKELEKGRYYHLDLQKRLDASLPLLYVGVAVKKR